MRPCPRPQKNHSQVLKVPVAEVLRWKRVRMCVLAAFVVPSAGAGTFSALVAPALLIFFYFLQFSSSPVFMRE